MHALNWIAEQKIKEAMNAGEFDNLPGQGEPLNFDTDFAKNRETAIPYTILKNAGYLPMPLLIRKEIEQMQRQAQSYLRQCRERTNHLFSLIESAWAELREFKNKPRDSNIEFLRLKDLPSETEISRWKRKRFRDRVAKIERLVHRYNATIQDYRIKYHDLLVEIDRKIEELHFNCIQEEVRQTSKFSHLLQIPPIDISFKLKEFDSEFRTLAL